MAESSPGPVWVLAGVDPSGGAGLHQDLRVLSALGVLARGIPTSLTVQNIHEVRRVFPVQGDLFRDMFEALLDVEHPAAIKVGLLPGSLIEDVLSLLERLPATIPFVLDPIFRFGSGDPFLDSDAFQTMAVRIFPRASLVSPNLPEASILLGREVSPDRESMRTAAEEILIRYGSGAVYLKGGHAGGDEKNDLFVTREESLTLTYPSLPISALHGGGCTLASLMAGCRVLLPASSWATVVRRARELFQKALDRESRRPGSSRRTLDFVFLPSTEVLSGTFLKESDST